MAYGVKFCGFASNSKYGGRKNWSPVALPTPQYEDVVNLLPVFPSPHG